MVTLEYIYLLQDAEFVKNGEPVYKIGKTKQENQNRFTTYTKGYIILFQSSILNINCEKVENFSKVILKK
jgi:hypothetical protein